MIEAMEQIIRQLRPNRHDRPLWDALVEQVDSYYRISGDNIPVDIFVSIIQRHLYHRVIDWSEVEDRRFIREPMMLLDFS